MTTYEAPAKVNLSLLVSPPRSDGYHPLESIVQTVEWCDLLEVELGQEGRDTLESDLEDNLVEKALGRLRESVEVPPLALTLTKSIPIAAGLGGGSADAAAALLAGSDFGSASRDDLPEVAHQVGADVALFLTGGSLMMTGVGYEIEVIEPPGDFAVAIVVPDFGLETKEVYKRWDALEGPLGPAVDDGQLPPALRGGMPMRNDLLPAALDLDPRLGDFIADVASEWGTTVCLTGSGSACFGYFATLDEAADAAAAVADLTRESRGVELRGHGVGRVPDPSNAQQR
jgi:4-diphosphocytidyl-2-C-methyl-D-erythritol kinase